jgi:cephalosporin hydroxylase
MPKTPVTTAGPELTPERQAELRKVRDDFHRLYYGSRWHGGPWLGVPTWKCPMDMMVFQEIIFERRPALIIETGTAFGGSALFMASLCDLIDNGRVMSIDIDPLDPLREHPRVTWVTGDSTSEAVMEVVRAAAAGDLEVMVVLDSDHKESHVSRELELYAPLVTPRQYLIVEDTNINGHPVLLEHGPGPWEAVGKFLPQHPEFSIDPRREKYLLSFNPGGYLERVR